MTKFHMELSVQGINTPPELFESAFDAMAEALYECQGIENADLAGDRSTQIATFSMDVDEEDEVAALTLGLSAVRTSLHASGGSTAGWENHFEMLRQTIETQAGMKVRDLIDA